MCMDIIVPNLFHTRSKLHLSNPEQFAKWILPSGYRFKEEAGLSLTRALWCGTSVQVQAQTLKRSSKEKATGQTFKDRLSNGHMLMWMVSWIGVYRIQGGYVHALVFSRLPKWSTYIHTNGQVWKHPRWVACGYTGHSCHRIGSQQRFAVILTFSLVLSFNRRESRANPPAHPFLGFCAGLNRPEFS